MIRAQFISRAWERLDVGSLDFEGKRCNDLFDEPFATSCFRRVWKSGSRQVWA